MPNIFDRAMFQAANKPTKAEEGITQGFDMEEEIPEDEMLEEVSQRKPNSPEILMNTLRGDMRSVDARYQELADMVGEDVAMETPPEILALLQAQLAAQQEGSMGIGALPPGQGVPPPPMPAGAPPMPTPQMGGGMPPPPQMGEAPGAVPQGPQGFAQGGEVGNPSQGIAHFKGGGSVAGPVSIVQQAAKALPQKTPEQIAAEQAAAARAAEAARIEAERQAAIKLQQERDAAYSSPTVTDSAGKLQANAAFAPEVARRFMQTVGPGVQTGQSQRIAAKQYGGVPQYGTGMAPNYGFNPFAQQMQGRQAVPQYAGAGAYNFAQQPRQFNQGGIASLGNFSQGIADAGRNGDTVLAHITPEQEQYLTDLGGGVTINPQTGLPEHFMGMQALGNMGTALATRAAPYLQQANVLAGRALYNPTFTEPTLTQTRTTLGTFGPKVAEGMEMYYPTLTQGLANSRLGQMVATGAEKLSQTPMWARGAALLASVPGANYVMDAFDNPNMVPGNKNAPKVPGDTATGWVPPPAPEQEGGSSPINWNNLPAAPSDDTAAAPATEGDKTNKVIANAIAKKTQGERLDEYMAENLPIFEKYLGGDKSYDQAQALFLLADLGLKFASTRKPGDTLVSSLARSASGIPAGLSALAANTEQARRQVKSAALTSGLQTIAAQDKAEADIRKELTKKIAAGDKQTWDDLGGGMYRVKDSNGKVIAHTVDPTVKEEFNTSPMVPLQKISDTEYAITSPYAKITTKPAATVRTESARKTLESDKLAAMDVVDSLDAVMKDVASVYGPGAWWTDFKNNVIVSVAPNMVANPDTDFVARKAQVEMARKKVVTAMAKMGDTGNIAVSERKLAEALAGDNPAKFFSNGEVAMKNLMTLRTEFANIAFKRAAQLGHTDYNITLDVPNLGTVNDPIPQDKARTYLDLVKQSNPNAQVYIRGKNGQVTSLNVANTQE